MSPTKRKSYSPLRDTTKEEDWPIYDLVCIIFTTIMFIASSNELAEFVDSLLLAPLNKDILAILKNEDEK
jgi:hypothetical protein